MSNRDFNEPPTIIGYREISEERIKQADENIERIRNKHLKQLEELKKKNLIT